MGGGLSSQWATVPSGAANLAVFTLPKPVRSTSENIFSIKRSCCSLFFFSCENVARFQGRWNQRGFWAAGAVASGLLIG